MTDAGNAPQGAPNDETPRESEPGPREDRPAPPPAVAEASGEGGMAFGIIAGVIVAIAILAAIAWLVFLGGAPSAVLP